MDIGSMAYSDQVVFETLKRLISVHGSDRTISQEMIADESGAALRTVQRSLGRLMNDGKVIGTFTPQIGYRYRLPDGHATRAG